MEEYLESLKRGVQAIEREEPDLELKVTFQAMQKVLVRFLGQLNGLDLLIDSSIIHFQQLGRVPGTQISKLFSFDQKQIKENVQDVLEIQEEVQQKIEELDSLQQELEAFQGFDIYDSPEELQPELLQADRLFYDCLSEMNYVKRFYEETNYNMKSVAGRFQQLDKEKLHIDYQFTQKFLVCAYENLKKEKKEALAFDGSWHWWEDNSALYQLLKQIFDWNQEQLKTMGYVQGLGFTTMQMLDVNEEVDELAEKVKEVMALNF